MKKFLSILVVLLIIISLVSCNKNISSSNNNATIEDNDTSTESSLNVLSWPQYKTYKYDEESKVKNIILMIGDGMGENTIKNAEIVKGDKLLMQGLKHTTYVSTDSLDGTTDSAAASTAMSCGVKTHNQYIGVDSDGNDVESICEFAMSRGLKTGLVATQIICHATPAGMICHSDYRQLYNELTKQEIMADVDILFGGGSEYHSKSVQRKIYEHHYTYIDKEDELNKLTYKDNQKVLGMFAYNAMYAGVTPSLASMTNKALELLNSDKGFFLMVEGSNIDVQLSKIDMNAAIKEMMAFDQSVNVVLEFAQNNPGTLVVITADHETGGVKLPKSMKVEDVNNQLITSNGSHTNENVLLMAAGAQSDEFSKNNLIENTDISKIMRKLLNDSYGNAPIKLKNSNKITDGDQPLQQ